VQLGREDALSLANVGFALAFVVDDRDQGAALIDRALALNPNLAVAWYFSGLVNAALLGQPDKAIHHCATAMRLNPLDPLFYAMQTGTALSHFVAGRYEEASRWADQALQHPGGQFNPFGLRIAAASKALAGRLDEARKIITRLRSVDPGLCTSNLRDRAPFGAPELFARLAEGLRKAGLPE
jgi:tetratricopeptide (TPR) repeat protein